MRKTTDPPSLSNQLKLNLNRNASKPECTKPQGSGLPRDCNSLCNLWRTATRLGHVWQVVRHTKDLLALPTQNFGAFHLIALCEYLSGPGRESASPSPQDLVLMAQVARSASGAPLSPHISLPPLWASCDSGIKPVAFDSLYLAV